MFVVAHFLTRLTKKDNHKGVILVLSGALFFVRIILVVFADTIGTMPYIKPEVVFYGILTAFGVFYSVYMVKHVEKRTLASFGWKTTILWKSILIGVLSILPLFAFLPIIVFTTGLEVLSAITWEKVFIAVCFGFILGGFYEEVLFRGIIQYHASQITTKYRTIGLTALIFVATHIGYLPFDAFGIYYMFLFIMALELSFLRARFNSVACCVLHGGIVFILVLLV